MKKYLRRFLILLTVCILLPACTSTLPQEELPEISETAEQELKARTAMITEWVDKVYAQAEPAKPVVEEWLAKYNAETEKYGYVEYFPYNIHCLYPVTYLWMEGFFGDEDRPDSLAEFLKTNEFAQAKRVFLPAPGCENKYRSFYLDQWIWTGGNSGTGDRNSISHGKADSNLYRGTIIKDLSAFDFGEIQDMRFLFTDQLGAPSFVYVFNGKTEYLIAYGGWLDQMHLTQGVVYTVDEVIERLRDWYGL